MAATTATLSPTAVSFDPKTSSSPAIPEPLSLPPSAPLTAAQIAMVKATAPVLKEHGVAITTVFYQNLLAAHPELNNVFNATSQASGRQPRALAGTVLAYATYIDDLPRLRSAVERIAHKHASLHVQPEQYAVVGKHLIEAIGIVLGNAATPDIVGAWTAAYAVLASVFVAREGELYAAQEKWVGWRQFAVARREPESACIESFYLRPVDGTPLPSYLPGQYISLRVFVPELGYLQPRQYSLSDAPQREGDYYRISVKKEPGEETRGAGHVSNLLHDEVRVGHKVELTHPQGDFFLDPADRSKEGVPLVLISAGVGATPVTAILNSVAGGSSCRGGVDRPISWVHASRSRSVQPFAEAVRRIQAASAGRVSSHVFLRNVGPDDEEGLHYSFGGARMDLDRLDGDRDLFVSNGEAEYYVCGPEGFMADVRASLEARGVDRGRIHLELFATGDVE